MSADAITLTAAPAVGKPGRFVIEGRTAAALVHRDTLDLNSATRRGQFIRATVRAAFGDDPGRDTAAVAADLERQLLTLAAAPPGDPEPPSPAPAAADSRAAELAGMPADIRAEAEGMLEDPDLMRRVSADIREAGVVGEEATALTLYLIGTSAQLPRPLSGIVRGPSTSGKSYVVERVAGLFPPEVVLRATSLTTNALYYFPPGTLRHRLVVGGERSRVEDDEKAEATRALREMIEAGRLSKAVPLKQGDRITTELVEQDGPVAYVETTTLANVFDEDANRCLMLSTDEREEQTRRILAATAAAAAGRAGRNLDRLRAVHHAAQRMLPRVDVVVPFADAVAALYSSARIESRRDMRHLLQLVKAVALLHFKQRGRDESGKVVATVADYAAAEHLAQGPLGTAAGGLSAGACRFLDRLREAFRGEVPDTWREFTTTEARGLLASRSPVYGWLLELHEAGEIEQTQESKGRKPARWRLADADARRSPTGDRLPTADDVEAWAARTRGRKP